MAALLLFGSGCIGGMLWHPAPSPNYNGSSSQERISAMKIEGLPVIEVDESEEITVAVRADDLLEGNMADK
jgi:hypothetical protein